MQVEVVAFPDLVKKMVEATVAPPLLRLLSAVKSKESVPWPETQEARDVRELVEDQAEDLADELAAFDKVLGLSKYQGRVIIFQRAHSKPEKSAWQARRIEYAGIVTLPNTLEHMQTLCDHLLEDDEDEATRVAMWVHPLPGPSILGLTLVYIRHQRGWDSVFVQRDNALIRLPLEGTHVEDAFALLSPVAEPGDSAYWRRCLKALLRMAEQEIRPELTQVLKDHAQVNLDDKLWKELCGAIFFQKEFLYFLMEVGRSIASRPMQEGQVLLTSLVEGLARATKLFDERLGQVQRDHKRELKRRITDHDKLQAAYKGLMERANRQAKDLSARMTQPAASPASSTAAKGPTLERALADLF